MTKRRTLNSLAFPDDADDAKLPVKWAAAATTQILRIVWSSFDRLKAGPMQGINWNQPMTQLERSLTQLHCIEVQVTMREESDGYSSLIAVHEFDEFERLGDAKAKPPSNDIGFVHTTHRRWVWPLEAKVLPTPATLHDYLADVQKFKDGIAGPLVGEGGIIGYLRTGTSETFFDELAEKIAPLATVRGFAKGLHRASRHDRKGAPNLRLHHMAMACA